MRLRLSYVSLKTFCSKIKRNSRGRTPAINEDVFCLGNHDGDHLIMLILLHLSALFRYWWKWEKFSYYMVTKNEWESTAIWITKIWNTKFGWKSAKFVPHSGWNFASSPTDRENIAENFANSQFYSTQTCQPRKKVKENS